MQNIWTTFYGQKDFYLNLLWEHLKISLIAILIAFVIGGLVGILISEFQRSAKPTLGVINFLYTIPSISMLGFLIPFSGVGNATAIIALTIYALLPMVRNTHTGITHVDEAILEAAKGMGSTPVQILFRIKLPLAMPVIMSGIRSMVTMTIALAGIASFIGAGGLGVAIYRGITTNNVAMTMVSSLLIAFLALFLDFVLGLAEHLMQKRDSRSRRTSRVLAVAVLVCGIVLAVTTLWQNRKQDVIRIATKPMTEQYILGDMLQKLIEQDTGMKVELTQGIGGGTSNIEPAMEKGEYDLYPEYTGTGWNVVLKKDGIYTEKLFDEMKKEYEEKLHMQWTGMYGFNNTYGIAVRKELADKYQLKTYSDLAAISDQLIFGAEYDFFERQDGYQALCDAFGYHFKKTMDMDIGLKYQAINQGKIDAMIIFTTDGQLTSPNIVVLQDDTQFFPSYLCGTVIRDDTLKAHPELQGVFDQLAGTISDSDMAQMNYEVESEGKDPADVADAFLKSHGLVK